MSIHRNPSLQRGFFFSRFWCWRTHLWKTFFSFTYVDVGEHIILIRVFLFQILEFWLNHHDQALLVRLNKSWESSICERKSAFRFKRRPNHLFKPQWKKVMAKICSKRAFIYWSFLPLEIFEIIRRIAYFHNLIHFDDFFVAISRHFLFYFQAMCETDGEFPEESCISSPPPTFNQHLFFPI